MSIPKKTLSILPEGWQKTATQLFSEGMAIIQVVKKLGITRDLHNRFMEEEPEYKEVFTHGVELSECWWYETGKDNLHNRNFNNPLFNQMVSRMFNWNREEMRKPPQKEKESKDDILNKYKAKTEAVKAEPLQ